MMTTHGSASNLATLHDQVAQCATECANAVARAQDPHLQTRLINLAGQVEAVKTRIEDAMNAGSVLAPPMLASLTQEASAATSAMKNATSDDSLYQALLVVQKFCMDIEKALPAR
jgi:hypothetical protein